MVDVDALVSHVTSSVVATIDDWMGENYEISMRLSYIV